MLRVGLTGSIAVGKSFVAGVLKELGCRVLDADQTAREVVAPGTKGLRAVVENFGNEIVSADGTLDRARLGALVFADQEKRALLNSIVHPLVISAQDEQLQRWESEDADGIAVIDAALMIESGGYKRFDKIIVVHCQREIQIERLRARNNFSPEEAEMRIASQMPQEEKKLYADYLIDTSKGFADARRSTEKVYLALKELSRTRSASIKRDV